MENPPDTEVLEHAIRRYRTTTATVTLLQNGTPLAGQEILVQQKRHKFLFGSSWGDASLALANGELEGRQKEQAELRNERFLGLFNQVTFPFYWARFEPRKGQPQTQRLLNAARWYQYHDCAVKGHPLCWHTLTADWLLDMSTRGILQAQQRRIGQL